MTPDRYEQIKRVFLAVSEMRPQQVAAYLNEACAHDSDLRQEVESLMRYHLPETIVGAVGGPVETAQAEPVGAASAARADRGPPRDALPGAATAARFPPGTILAGRYRVIGPLGRGGMGDVYRADDLKLDESVALKFLSRERTGAPDWLARYQNEVRLARRVTHPNVLRVFDISETEGEVFISMEYVDGEDLASLLRRIGRVTGDKAIQIARQLCAGLGAAHDRGVLHRDLKPANIMIDGRGQVRIADFGIAALAAQAEENGALIGTPAYMAPELFEGAAPSVQSDLFSLGIVLYAAATGKEPFDGKLFQQCGKDSTPLRPSTHVADMDPAFERVIQQCLERDPKRRPDSAYAIAAALPGGDPLVLAVAAGETPSPTMVAAGGAGRAWRPWTVTSCFAISLLALFLVVCLADRTFLLPQAGLTKPPTVLADTAQQIMTALGHPPIGPQHRQGFAIDRGYVEDAARAVDHCRTWESLSSGHPPAVSFWYRAGGGQVHVPGLLGEPSSAQVQTPDDEPAAVTVRLDGQGRLLQYVVTSQLSELPDASSRTADWSVPFKMAGLRMADFQPIRPRTGPPMYADTLVAWQGSYPDNPDQQVHIEGASLGGRTVFFEVVPPWTPDWTAAEESIAHLSARTPPLRLVLNLLAIALGGFLAWHNLRLGRGDHRGANKLVLFVLALGLLEWLLGERHVASLREEVAVFYLW